MKCKSYALPIAPPHYLQFIYEACKLNVSVMLVVYLDNYPAIHSMGRDTKFTMAFSFFMYGNVFLSQGFTNRHEILHGGSAASWTGLLLFWGIAQGMAEFSAPTAAIWQDIGK